MPGTTLSASRRTGTRSLGGSSPVVALLAIALLILGIHFNQNLQFLSSPPSPDWSRPVRLGEGISNYPPALAATDSGELVAVWAGKEGLAFALVAGDGKIRQQGILPLPVDNPRRVKLAGGQGILHLLWQEGGGGKRLVHAILGSDATVRSGPAIIGSDTESYDVARAAGGDAYAIVGAGGNVAAYLLGSEAGQSRPLAEPFALGPFEEIDVQVDQAGNVHAAFQVQDKVDRRYQDFFYRVLDRDGRWGPLVSVGPAKAGPRLTARPFSLGLDGKFAYLFYALEVTGPATGEASLNYYTVSLDGLTPGPLKKVNIPSGLMGSASGYVNDPVVLPGQHDVLPVALATEAEFSRLRSHQDIGVATFRDGQQIGYVPASRTAPASLKPNMVSAPGGTYLSWLHTAGFNRYQVVLASSNPSFATNANRRTGADWLDAAMTTVSNLLFSLAAVVFAAYWLVPAYLVLGFTCILALELTERRPWLALAPTFLAHAFFQLTTVLESFYAPIALVNMPTWLRAPWTAYVLPAVIGLACAWYTYEYWRRHPRASVFAIYTAFALTDMLVLLLYAPFLMY